MRMIEIGQIRTECKALSFSPSEVGGGELCQTKGGGVGMGGMVLESKVEEDTRGYGRVREGKAG